MFYLLWLYLIIYDAILDDIVEPFGQWIPVQVLANEIRAQVGNLDSDWSPLSFQSTSHREDAKHLLVGRQMCECEFLNA